MSITITLYYYYLLLLLEIIFKNYRERTGVFFFGCVSPKNFFVFVMPLENVLTSLSKEECGGNASAAVCHLGAFFPFSTGCDGLCTLCGPDVYLSECRAALARGVTHRFLAISAKPLIRHMTFHPGAALLLSATPREPPFRY